MKRVAIALCLFACIGSAVAADAPPAPPRTHAVSLTDDEIQVISFMAQQIGSRCDISANGQQFCAAQLRAAALIDDLGKQINVKPAGK